MKTKLPIVLLAAVLVLPSCRKEETGVTSALPAADFSTYFSENPIPAAQSIPAIRASAKPGDEVVVSGLIMGRVKVFVEDRASFLLGDPGTLTPCNTKPDDGCETPWDVCCDSREAKLAGVASIQIVDAEGRVLPGGLKGVNGLKELSGVTVRGKIDPGSTPESMVINVAQIHVDQP